MEENSSPTMVWDFLYFKLIGIGLSYGKTMSNSEQIKPSGFLLNELCWLSYRQKHLLRIDSVSTWQTKVQIFYIKKETMPA